MTGANTKEKLPGYKDDYPAVISLYPDLRTPGKNKRYSNRNFA